MMNDDELGQDELAAQWAAALEDDDGGGGGDAADLAAEMLAGQGVDTGGGDPGGGGGGGGGEDEALADEWARALAEDESASMQKEKEQSMLASTAQTADFKDLTEDSKTPRPDAQKHELDFILDIPLDVSAELGRTRLLINELLQLGQGSVVELNKLAGEPLEIFVNGKLVARGEAVVINEKFGVRLTDIISPIERVKQLG